MARWTELNPPQRLLLGPGLGPLAGKVWRIGLMGESSRQDSVVAVLSALEVVLKRAGMVQRPGAAVSAALEVYSA